MMSKIWYWTRVAICIVSFGMVFPNILSEGLDPEPAPDKKPN